MIERRHLVATALGTAAASKPVSARQAAAAVIRTNELGPENPALNRRAGLWDATEVVWDWPGASPASTTETVADGTGTRWLAHGYACVRRF